MMRTIYLDMDGVVADFNAYVSNLLKRQVGWEAADLTSEEWNFLSSVDRLYYNLDPLPYSARLVETSLSYNEFKIEFLTAIPRVKSIPTAEKDKREWLDKYFPGIKMNTGPHSRDKSKWAKSGDILIDDKKENAIEWFEAGGIAIRHTGDIDKTLQSLEIAVKITSNPVLLGSLL
jgi:5'(3')-deoxyribonucleotidase